MAKSKKKSRKARKKSKQQLSAVAVTPPNDKSLASEPPALEDTAVTDQELASIDMEQDEAPAETTKANESEETAIADESETTAKSTIEKLPSEPAEAAPVTLPSKPVSVRESFFARPIAIILLILALILVGAIAWGGYEWSSTGSLRAYSAAGIPIEKNMSASQLAPKLKNAVQSYRFTINDGQNTTTYSAADAGLSANETKTIEAIRASQTKASLLDNLMWWQMTDLPIVLTIDESKLATFISDHMVRTTIEPKNATLTTETGEIVTTAETNGEGITVKDPRGTLVTAVSRVTPHYTITLTKQPIPAHVKTADLQPLVDDITAVSRVPVSVTVGEQSVTAPASTIIRWVDPVQEGDTKARFEINSGKVEAWINELADTYTSPTQNEVHAKNPDGTERVLTTGRNGIEVSGDAQAAKDIVVSLKDRKPITKNLAISARPFKIINVTAYDKWLLVDLSNHMLYAYERDQQVKAFPMSAGAPDTPTVVGEFKIYSKIRSQTMRGPNTDGTSYNVPNVEWVSYFYKDYAIHGNYWRPLSVFGSLNTSHGCIGMPNASSQWVYEWAPIGTPVITYY